MAEVVPLDDHRAFRIGGSDAGSVCGVNKYESRVKAWARMTGNPNAQREPTEAMQLGNLLQPAVADLLAAHGYEVMPAPADDFTHPKRKWQCCHPDGFTAVDGAKALAELKTAGILHDEWNGAGVPAVYLCQVQHSLDVLGLDVAVIGVLAGGHGGLRVVHRIVERDDKLIARIVELESEFVDCLRSDDPGPLMSEPGDAALVYPEATRELTRFVGADWDDYRAAKMLDEQYRIVKEQRNRAVEKVKARMGDADAALSPHDQIAARWTTFDKTTLDQKALKEHRPEIYAEYAVTKPQRRFTLE